MDMILYPHQKNALNQTKDLNRVAYYHDMGLGKTFTGAEKMVRLGAKINLLICQKSKIQDWITHFEQHYSQMSVVDLTVNGAVLTLVGWKFGMRVVGIINYELAWRRKDLLRLHNFTLMLDESSLIQNRKAKQTKFILKLQPMNVILLSGTPTAGKYENLWTQAHLLGWDISESLYNKQYINWKLLTVPGGMKVKVVDKSEPYKNIDRLKEKFHEHGAVFLKTEECFDLPEQTFIDVKVRAPKEYQEFMQDGYAVLNGEEIIGDTSLTKRLRARQLCGEHAQNKLNAFRDLILSTNDRLIVFYNFNEELAVLIHMCEEAKRPVSIINGQIKDCENYECCSNSVTLVQYQAGAMGLNLQKANKIVYFTPPERCELWMQSQKRIHRIGQTRPCFYYKLICEKSIEENIYEALERGTDYTDELFRKDFKNEFSLQSANRTN